MSPTAKWPVAFTVTIALIGMSVRGPIVGVPPLIGQLSADLHLSGSTAGLLTSLPLLCLALTSPLVAVIARWLGLDLTLVAGLALLVIATAARPWGSAGQLVFWTVVAALGIAVSNVVTPVVIRRHAGRRTGVLTAILTSSYGAGAALTTAAAVPLSHVLGWRGALAALAGPAAIALCAWVLRMRHGTDSRGVSKVGAAASAEVLAVDDTRPAGKRSAAWLNGDAWWLAVFFGLQSALFYGVSTWLPGMLRDGAGVSDEVAGTATAVFHLVGIGGMLSVPLLMRHLGTSRHVALVSAAGWLILFAGLDLGPVVWLPWVLIGGFAQGAGISLALALIAVRPIDADYGRDVSALVQSVGYGLGAVGPILLGWLHDTSDGWATVLIACLSTTAVMGMVGMRAATNRRIGSPIAGPSGGGA
ncbi:MFS transporter [Georgenia sp. AZ-5]|uniref:MFS transporter n=1 Tax=Georgenia sp. AZ-5 TaxID=3367526 RepID=UPI003753F3A1